jgi:RND family efflux transporter MFP subunit
MSFKILKQSFFRQSGFAPVVLLYLAGAMALCSCRRTEVQTSDGQNVGISPVAGVAKVAREDMYKDVKYLAEFRPYVQAELDTKVSGYVSRMNVDFGDKVKAGQLLATIEVPELEAQFVNALATEQRAEADYTNADLIYTRLLAVDKAHPNLVAQQELDTAEAHDHAAAAAIAATQADVQKYRTMVSYTNITAPFDGVITRRYVDQGQLVQAGTSSGRPLLRVSDNYRLRLDFPVTVDYVKNIQPGDPVEVKVDSLNGETFDGTIARFTYDVDDATRTMTTEIEVTNSDLRLIPGMYATVNLKVEKHSNALTVPVEAVNLGKAPTVLVVNKENKIEDRPVTLGLEAPDKFEVLSGLQEGDLVVVGNRAAFQPGEKVEPKLVQLTMRDQP